MVWSPDGAGSPPTSSTDGVGSDVEMWDAEDGKEEGIIEWEEFPFVGLELRPLLCDAFPDPRDLRRVLRRPWVREMDSFGDAVVSIREAPDAAAAERAGAAFIAKLRRLLAEQAQPVLPTNQARRAELARTHLRRPASPPFEAIFIAHRRDHSDRVLTPSAQPVNPRGIGRAGCVLLDGQRRSQHHQTAQDKVEEAGTPPGGRGTWRVTAATAAGRRPR